MLGNNMFTYCNNNPANYIDPAGTCKNTFCYYLKVDCGNVYCPTSESYKTPNYTIHGNNKDADLTYVTRTVYEDISKEDANHFYDTIKKGNYAEVAGTNILQHIGEYFNAPWSVYFSLVNTMADGISNLGTKDTRDKENRLLYLEEGYNVVVVDRGYMVGDSNRTEKEYFIYDSEVGLSSEVLGPLLTGNTK